MTIGKFVAAGVLAAALSTHASSASAATVHLYDGTFNSLVFVQSVPQPSVPPRPYGFGPGALQSINASVMVGGNVDNIQPDPNAINIIFNWTGASSNSGGLAILDTLGTYNPHTQGAIVDLSMAVNKMQPGSGPLAATPARFLLQQNGNFFLYQTASLAGTGGQYTHYAASGLHSTDFTNVCLVNCGAGHYTEVGPATLDFSSNGGAITFGIFARSTNSNVGGAAINVFYDNFDVQVTSAVPEPSTWAMMMLGFASLGFFAWRRNRVAAQAI